MLETIPHSHSATLQLWEEYAPKYGLHLQCYTDDKGPLWHADALDDRAGCWTTVAKGRSMEATMLAGVTRVRTMSPGGPIIEFKDPLVGPN